jgi:hypothetical protein
MVYRPAADAVRALLSRIAGVTSYRIGDTIQDEQT